MIVQFLYGKDVSIFILRFPVLINLYSGKLLHGLNSLYITQESLSFPRYRPVLVSPMHTVFRATMCDGHVFYLPADLACLAF